MILEERTGERFILLLDSSQVGNDMRAENSKADLPPNEGRGEKNAKKQNKKKNPIFMITKSDH